jgi:hypothetical protein
MRPGKGINISTVLAGQRLGIKDVVEGIWLASFMHSDWGYIDQFGPRFSPMSQVQPSPICPEWTETIWRARKDETGNRYVIVIAR